MLIHKNLLFLAILLGRLFSDPWLSLYYKTPGTEFYTSLAQPDRLRLVSEYAERPF